MAILYTRPTTTTTATTTIVFNSMTSLFSPPPPSRPTFSLFASTTRSKIMSTHSSPNSSPSLPLSPLPHNRIVLGCGGVGVDFLAAVAAYPKPDDKIRTTSLKLQGGGNAGNALTCAARLGLNPRLISKVADDAQGRGILEELEADGVDASFLVVMNKKALRPRRDCRCVLGALPTCFGFAFCIVLKIMLLGLCFLCLFWHMSA